MIGPKKNLILEIAEMTRNLVIGVAGMVICVAGIGCQPQGATNIDGSNSFTSADTDTINAVLAAIESASTAANTTQGAFTPETQTGRTSASICPELTFSASNSNGLSLAVTIDFGGGCSLDGMDLFCAGSAAGTLSSADGTLALAFDGLSCDDKALNGSVDYTFETSQTSVTTQGAWDLSYSDAQRTVDLIANGNASHDSTTHATTIALMTGTVTADGDAYAFTWTQLVTSFFQNGNFVPQAGEMSVTTAQNRSIIVQFDADSPSTGDVLMSINGSEFFTYNIFDNE